MRSGPKKYNTLTRRAMSKGTYTCRGSSEGRHTVQRLRRFSLPAPLDSDAACHRLARNFDRDGKSRTQPRRWKLVIAVLYSRV